MMKALCEQRQVLGSVDVQIALLENPPAIWSRHPGSNRTTGLTLDDYFKPLPLAASNDKVELVACLQSLIATA